MAGGAILMLACAPPDQAVEARDWKLYQGRQLIVLPIGGGRLPAELIALALP